MQPPAQELGARDLHETSWTFRHIYRGIEPFKTSPLPPPPFPSHLCLLSIDVSLDSLF